MLIKRKIIQEFVDKGQLLSKQNFIAAMYAARLGDAVTTKVACDLLCESFSDVSNLIPMFSDNGVCGMTVTVKVLDEEDEEYNLYDLADLYWMVASLWVIQHKSKGVPDKYKDHAYMSLDIDPWLGAQ